MPTATLPQIKDVKDTLEGLLGRDVDVRGADLWAPQPNTPLVATDFRDDADRLAAAAVVDLPLGVQLGCAVGLMPPGVAREMAGDGELTPMVAENLYEVFNVVSSVFNTADATHVRLTDMYRPDEALPAEVARWLSSPVGRLDLDVDVHGYGGGHFVLLTGA